MYGVSMCVMCICARAVFMYSRIKRNIEQQKIALYLMFLRFNRSNIWLLAYLLWWHMTPVLLTNQH